MAVGRVTHLLSLPYKGCAYLVQDFWIKQLWKLVDECIANVNIPGLWIHQLQQKWGWYLMAATQAEGFLHQYRYTYI